jgi:hypothetical protein
MKPSSPCPSLLISIVLAFLSLVVEGQQKENKQALPDYIKKNHLLVQFNIHAERRGTVSYETVNPDFAIGYEREIVGFGNHRFYAGIRSGGYKEYVLTGSGWSHPEKTRLFVGLSPSYMLYINKRFRMQLNFLYDLLFPNDYDEIWSYWALEPSFQYFIGDLYAGISSTMGSFIFFDPRADMVKVGFKMGYRF